MGSGSATTDDPLTRSQEYLRCVRVGDDPTAIEAAIGGLSPARIEALSDAARKAFWLNLYNANVQRRLAADPERFEKRWRFFRQSAVPVAGRTVSLDDIEHGMLRRSRVKWGLGYLRNPFPRAFERRLRVDSLDPRIHFALNCGAASCPPIAFYSAESLADELAAATAGYLERSVSHEPDRGIVRVPRLLLWYRGDFGGKAGILDLLRRHDHIPDDARPRLKHRGYDWSLSLGDFRSDHSG